MAVSRKTLQEVARRIRELRESRGLSQEALGERAGVHRTYVGMVERAEKNLTLGSLEAFAKALGVRVRDLVERV